MTSTDRPASAIDLSREWQIAVTLTRVGDIVSKPFVDRYAKPYSLSLTEWRVIVVLAQNPGASAHEIASVTGMHPMNISRAVARLRASERLTASRDDSNHRRRNLHLTDSGTAVYGELIASSEEHAHRLLEVLSPAEREFFGAILDRLLDRALEISSKVPENEPTADQE